MSQTLVQTHLSKSSVIIFIKRLLIPVSSAFFACLDKLDVLLGKSGVGEISIDQLIERQARTVAGTDRDFVLVDVRSVAEQAVSIITSAITKEEFEKLPDNHRGKTVITYCTAGGRSYLYSRKLAKRGIPTLNLKAGIVGWCNAHLPLQTIDGTATNRVCVDTDVYSLPPEYAIVDRGSPDSNASGVSSMVRQVRF